MDDFTHICLEVDVHSSRCTYSRMLERDFASGGEFHSLLF